eukprot:CAMPEP_0170521956 /NCGR_PEP_ID=MMETSP0209-20121228/7393_1 /TAXON_ID=665100 ORGANISM="Litonotus pictus, Strain P1" /NCGR_SAMPLE_ID=MMETSP0209 /ASSEMBLY_ACC=CAM_ASM_000301 /LENGTH=140 /DNA_ID=CAMNT_0010809185 /DNA_START=11 /DNA_END=433 /DNA_ORIENTATION=-
MASSEDNWIATVCWHIQLKPNNIHVICLKRFWDDTEAIAYYDKVSTSYAKKFYSKNKEEKQYSESWSKYIPSKSYFKPCWVSYLDSVVEEEDYYLNCVKYFDSEEEAKLFYDSISEKTAKKMTVKFEVLDKEGYETGYLI